MKGFMYIILSIVVAILIGIYPEFPNSWNFIILLPCGMILGSFAYKAWSYDKLMRDRR